MDKRTEFLIKHRKTKKKFIIICINVKPKTSKIDRFSLFFYFFYFVFCCLTYSRFQIRFDCLFIPPILFCVLYLISGSIKFFSLIPIPGKKVSISTFYFINFVTTHTKHSMVKITYIALHLTVYEYMNEIFGWLWLKELILINLFFIKSSSIK